LADVSEFAEVAENKSADFDRIVAPLTDRLRRAFVARFGVEVGYDVHAETMAWAWQHRDQLGALSNPAGYLFRVGQSAARRHHRWSRGLGLFPMDFNASAAEVPELDWDVLQALRKIKPKERVSVLLVHGYGFSYREVAELLNVSEANITNHIHRGLAKLRPILKGES
jgi:DNA-directed RNA polymerase specialized sigma24 family protein